LPVGAGFPKLDIVVFADTYNLYQLAMADESQASDVINDDDIPRTGLYILDQVVPFWSFILIV